MKQLQLSKFQKFLAGIFLICISSALAGSSGDSLTRTKAYELIAQKADTPRTSYLSFFEGEVPVARHTTRPPMDYYFFEVWIHNPSSEMRAWGQGGRWYGHLLTLDTLNYLQAEGIDQVDGQNKYNIKITEHGKSIFKSSDGSWCYGHTPCWSTPIVSKDIEITGILKSEDKITAEVEYILFYKIINPELLQNGVLGHLRTNGVSHRYAIMKKYDDGWRVESWENKR